MFDFDEIIDRRGTHCTKWDMMQPLYGVAARRRHRHVGRRHGLPPAARGRRGAGGRGRRTASSAISATTAPTRRRSRGWMARRHGWEVDPAAIATTHGVVAGLAICLQAFTEPGDGVILFTPVYHAFYRIIRANRREIVAVAAGGPRGRPLRDGPRRARRRAHRPRADRSSSARRTTRAGGSGAATSSARSPTSARAHDLLLVSDEIHHDLVLPGNRHVPMPLAAPEILDRLVMLTATTKTFNIAGALTGNVIIPDEALRRRFAAAHLASGTSRQPLRRGDGDRRLQPRRRLGRRALPLPRRQRRDLRRRPRRDPRPRGRCRSTPPTSPGSTSPAPA